ncbi:MAG: radical SAM protein [Bacillota bacterium]
MDYHDVLLINPPSKKKEIYEHLGLGYLAACLRKHGISVRILNTTYLTVPQALTEIKGCNCKVLGVSIPFQQSGNLAVQLISRLKKDGVDAHVTIGGIFPTFSYREIMSMYPEIDTAVLGEGEETFVELVKAILNGKDWRRVSGIACRDNGEIIETEPRPLIRNLDTIPFPERDLLPEVLAKTNFAPMLTSRGCYGRCAFCSVVPFFLKFGPKYRLRSSNNVMEELDILYNKYNVRNVEFNDANFIGGKGRGLKRAGEIAEEILKRNMDLRFSIQCRPDDVDEEMFAVLKKAGLSKIFLGIESGSQSQLDRFRKDTTVEENLKVLEVLAKLDLIVFMGFITLDQETTLQEVDENMSFVRKADKIMPKKRLYYDLAAKLIPLAGTEAEKKMKDSGRYIGHSLRFTYKMNNPRLNSVYKSLALSDHFRRMEREARNYDRDWMMR